MEEYFVSYLPKGFFENLKEMNNISFTTREIDIIASINHARGNAKIASILNISPRTVETYITKIKRKNFLNPNSFLFSYAKPLFFTDRNISVFCSVKISSAKKLNYFRRIVLIDIK